MTDLKDIVDWPGVGEAQRRLGLSQTSLYDWLWAGKLKALQVCGRWRIDPEDLERARREREGKRKRQKRQAVHGVSCGT